MSFHHVGPGAVLRTGAVALLGLVTAFLTCSTAVLAADPATPAAAAPASGAADGAPKTGASAIQNLAGRWQGQGKIEVAGGQNEQVKCIATYFIRDSGTGIEQNLRCASSSYKVDVQTKLKIVGDQVTGTWLEQTTNSSGSATGQVKTGGFNIAIKGEAFSARMSVASGKGSQTLNITPQGLSITKITIGMTRSGGTSK